MICTAKTGTNADLFPDILSLYVPHGAKILDTTYGTGRFWRYVERPDLKRTTLDISARANIRGDFRSLPFPSNTFDAVVFDPPYAMGGPTLELAIQSFRLNQQRRLVGDIKALYQQGLTEIYRVLKYTGIAIVKCQDQMASGKQQWMHIEIMQNPLFTARDLFILLRSDKPMLRHAAQKSARKNHSYFVILSKSLI